MISPIEGLAPITGSVLEPGLAAENPSMFGLAFQSAIDHVKETDAEKVEAEYLLATGQLDNPASFNDCLIKKRAGGESVGAAAEQGVGRILRVDTDQPIIIKNKIGPKGGSPSFSWL